MRRLLATVSNCAVAPALLALSMLPLWSVVGFSDATRSDPSAAAKSTAHACGSDGVVVYQPYQSPGDEPECEAVPRTPAEIADARAYVIETAGPGYTMTLQGAEVAIGRLHPEFVVRLASAIREARDKGLPFAGVFSAYRPPAFGVGGFTDKFNSLHTYGLAVDMQGIGKPGSPEAKLWHEIAAKNGVVCPYGPRSRAEWNHCQPTSVKIILVENPLRDTVSAAGPFDLESMFEAGNALIASIESAVASLSRADATPPRALEAAPRDLTRKLEPEARRKTKRVPRAATARITTKSARHAKLATRGTARGKAKIAVEAGRSKTKIVVEAGRRKPKIAAEATRPKAKIAVKAGRRMSALAR